MKRTSNQAGLFVRKKALTQIPWCGSFWLLMFCAMFLFFPARANGTPTCKQFKYQQFPILPRVLKVPTNLQTLCLGFAESSILQLHEASESMKFSVILKCAGAKKCKYLRMPSKMHKEQLFLIRTQDRKIVGVLQATEYLLNTEHPQLSLDNAYPEGTLLDFIPLTFHRAFLFHRPPKKGQTASKTYDMLPCHRSEQEVQLNPKRLYIVKSRFSKVHILFPTPSYNAKPPSKTIYQIQKEHLGRPCNGAHGIFNFVPRPTSDIHWYHWKLVHTKSKKVLEQRFGAFPQVYCKPCPKRRRKQHYLEVQAVDHTGQMSPKQRLFFSMHYTFTPWDEFRHSMGIVLLIGMMLLYVLAPFFTLVMLVWLIYALVKTGYKSK